MRRAFAVVAAIPLLAGCAAVTESPPPREPQGTLTVFAAASLADVFDELAESFEREYPAVDVVLSYGGSSTLATQVIEGAPADLIATASEETMQPIVDAGLTANPIAFASNVLEIATPAGNPGNVAGLADFARPELAIALCAVEVPCGAVADRVLEAAGVVPSVDTFEQDVRALLTKIELGEVDAGLVYRTDIAASAGVEGVPAEGAEALPTSYLVASLTSSLNSAASAAFLQWFSVNSGPVLEGAGFGAP